jgi:hypothetical protein
MSKNYEVKAITKSTLREAIENNTYWKNGMAPIPKSKAIWLLANDRIQEDDYCGVIGYENEKIIAFIYMIPDFLNTGKPIKKIYWMLLWWVDNTLTNTIIGTYMYNEAVNFANKQIIIKAYAETASDFYNKQPYKIIASKLRHTLFFSMDTSMLLGRFPFLKALKPLLGIIDNLSYHVLKLINRAKLKKRTNTLTYEYINDIDNDTWAFLEPLCKNDLILKTKDYMNWQISNTQFTQTPTSKHRYFALQAGLSSNIHIHNLKIVKDATIIGFISYIVNYNECNVKYFLTKSPLYYNDCVDALMEHLYASKSKFIFTDDTPLADAISQRFSMIYSHRVMKNSLAHQSIDLDMTSVNLYDRDGHFY